MNENYTLTADSVQDSSSSQTTDVTETTVQPTQHTADRPPTDIAHHKSKSPRQPTGISFPTRDYDTSKQSFQVSWYNDFMWLEYSVERDGVFRFSCCFFGTTSDNALISVGFHDWKYAKVWDTTKFLAEKCGVSVTPPRPRRTQIALAIGR